LLTENVSSDYFEDGMCAEGFPEETHSPLISKESVHLFSDEKGMSSFRVRENSVRSYLSEYDDPLYWNEGSVKGPFVPTSDLRQSDYWESRPPLDPSLAVGRIVLFSFSPTSRAGFRGEKTASTMYVEDMKMKTKGLGAAAVPSKKEKKESGQAKKAFRSWEKLNPAERDKYERMVSQNVPYAFYRVCEVTRPAEEEGEHMFTMFQCSYMTLSLAEAAKRKAPKSKQQAVIRFCHSDVMNHAYWTSPFDVEYSGCDQPEPSTCEVCGEDVPRRTYCDGGPFRAVGPSAAPCNWAIICVDCRKDVCQLHPGNKD
jgi:hypothetical protein